MHQPCSACSVCKHVLAGPHSCPQAQEHMWNMPLQLSCPTFYDCGSRPTDADQAALEVQEGDIVVLVRRPPPAVVWVAACCPGSAGAQACILLAVTGAAGMLGPRRAVLLQHATPAAPPWCTAAGQ